MVSPSVFPLVLSLNSPSGPTPSSPLDPPTPSLLPAKALQKDDSVDSATSEPLLVSV